MCSSDLIIAGMLVLGGYLLQQPSSSKLESKTTVKGFLSADSEAFKQVLKPRVFIFPKDHGSHPAYRNEWWYFTGNIQTQTGRKFGYELTFFRFALTPESQPTPSHWRNNQIYMAHFALTDVDNKQFYTDRTEEHTSELQSQV